MMNRSSLRRSLSLLLFSTIGLLAATAYSPSQVFAQKKKKDGGAVNGKIWSMTVRKAEGNVGKNDDLEHMNPKVRVRGFEIFGLAGKKIGTYRTPQPDKMIVKLTENTFKGYTAELMLTRREPPTWKGFGTKEGSDEKLWFQFIFLED